MLSLPEDWNYTLSGLAYISSEGKDSIRSAVAELEKAGYLNRSRVRDEQGRLLGMEYTIREQPFFLLQSAQEEPDRKNPALGNQTQLNKEKQITDPLSKDSLPFPLPPFQEPVKVEEPREAKEAKRKNCEREKSVRPEELDDYRDVIRENIGYAEFVQERPYDAPQLDEMVELMVEAVCSKKETLRVAGNDFPQAVVKSRLLKLDGQHIRFVFDCLRENTTLIRNVKQYLLTVLYNAPVTIENHYAAQVNHDLRPGEPADFGASSPPRG